MIELKDIHLRDKIPENLLRDKKVNSLADALSKSLQDISLWAYKINYTQSLRDLPDEILEHLLWENHIGPDEGLRLAKRREAKIRLIESSPELHRTKGTPYAIEKALEVVGLKGNVEEWYEYNGSPYWFLVELSSDNDLSDLMDIKSLIMEYKNRRSWFDGFVILLETEGIIVFDDSYDYPVFYPTCGEFSGEKEFSNFNVGQFVLRNDSYDYPVEYPVTEKGFTQLDAATIDLKSDTYGYIKEFPVTGEMVPLHKHVTTLTGGAATTSAELYDYNVTHPICGEFYAEGE